uniref:major histocompatibility complex class I-related gene protein-like n=1 Tax=Gasterosteus aculeatus aculeatus TaxID=481459 RepID=UPI001A99367C|nr:major histocompatibility complex class I-related gene protein-like [Gasterosteus aculeatus aculeatus]
MSAREVVAGCQGEGVGQMKEFLLATKNERGVRVDDYFSGEKISLSHLGVHIYQNMYGCEWDEETNKVKGYYQYGYDGEDFISFDLQTEQWIAAKQQAVLTKQEWDQDRVWTAQNKNYLTYECPESLKTLLKYGRSSLMRTERPSVSLLQKTPSSPVSCHATGFYPDRADLFWSKDGEQLHEDVDLGEILPNHDGTFQMRVDLKLSSVPAEDWRRYDCVFQLSGVDENIVTKLNKTRTNREKPAGSTSIIIIIIIAVAVLVVIIAAVVGFKVYRNRNAKRRPSSSSSFSSSDGFELSEEVNPNL